VLIVEVVSQSERQDYVTKRAEYENAGVLEYWMADPNPNRNRVKGVASLQKMKLLTSKRILCQGKGNIVSLQFPDLDFLSVDQILSPHLSEI
jgi:Uma2 family endonuclease